MSRFRVIAKKLRSLFLLIAVLVIYKCPLKALFGIPCAGCGLTRAMLCAAKLDFLNAFRYHPLFGVVGVELLYLVFRKRLIRQGGTLTATEATIAIVTILLFAVVYILRFYHGILPG